MHTIIRLLWSKLRLLLSVCKKKPYFIRVFGTKTKIYWFLNFFIKSVGKTNIFLWISSFSTLFASKFCLIYLIVTIQQIGFINVYFFPVNGTVGYCYHSVNVISLMPHQSDHIKRLPLYHFSNFCYFKICAFFILLLLGRLFTCSCY